MRKILLTLGILLIAGAVTASRRTVDLDSADFAFLKPAAMANAKRAQDLKAEMKAKKRAIKQACMPEFAKKMAKSYKYKARANMNKFMANLTDAQKAAINEALSSDACTKALH